MIYFVENVDSGHIKIGWASDPIRRIADMQTGNPSHLVLLATMEGGESIESSLHERFQCLHYRGEWFRRDRSLYDFIVGYATLHESGTPSPTQGLLRLQGLPDETRRRVAALCGDLCSGFDDALCRQVAETVACWGEPKP